jgi:thiol-disulfide isomerase/thioredoxin
MFPILEGTERRLNLPGNKFEIAGTLMDGQPFDWEAYRGKVVLVDYWASWCPQCLAEVPNMLQAYRDYHDKGFEIVGVCLDDDRRLAEETMQQNGMVWPQLFYDTPPGAQEMNPLAAKYGIIGIPRAILVDQQGKVVTMLARGRLLDMNLEKLLGPPGSNNDAAGATGTRASQLSSPTTR